jgi:hypothetical protein
MKTQVNVYPENQYTELTLNIQVPFCNKQKDKDISITERQNMAKAYSCDLLGAFSKRLIDSLERRMTACQNNLIKHIDDVEYNDEFGHIVYCRKDKTRGAFNVTSFKGMQEAVEALKSSSWEKFMNNTLWVDQSLKALLNDTEQNHTDEGVFKYSELVSLLCECHVLGNSRG